MAAAPPMREDRARARRAGAQGGPKHPASLPRKVPTLEGWQISPYYKPAREVGGDFYDFFDLEDGRVGVAVGDATGKGTPAALAVSATSSMLRAVAQALGSSSPGSYWPRSTRRWWLASPPTCSSPASTPSSTPKAVASPTPTLATTCLTSTVTVKPRS
jgi:hypothetical protein